MAMVLNPLTVGSLQKSEDNSHPDMKRRISLAASVTHILEPDMA